MKSVVQQLIMSMLFLGLSLSPIAGDTGGKQIIGRSERIDFPALDLFGIEAKIDTGAYNSSLHCTFIEKTEHLGLPYVHFKPLDPTHSRFKDTLLKMPVFKEGLVKNSFGESEKRIFIKTQARLAGKTLEIHLSLTNRGEMQNPILIGRRALDGKFLVDPSQKNLSRKKK